MRTLSVAIDEDIIETLLGRDGLASMADNVVGRGRGESEHFLCPEAELGRRYLGVFGLDKNH